MMLFIAPSTCGQHDASAANPLAMLVDVRETMTAFTLGLSIIFRRMTFTAQNIFTRGYRFQMRRIEALSISAQMVKLFPFWDRSHNDLIENPVHKFGSPSDFKGRIAVRAMIPWPNPTFVFFHGVHDTCLTVSCQGGLT